MNQTTLTYTAKNRVATVILNRPDRRNALDDTSIRELTEVLQAVGRTNDIRVAILSGSGGSFCAGMDLNYLQAISQERHEDNLEDARSLLKLLELISALRKPIIAMVEGPALGGGCGIASACDFVFAGRSKARFGTPEVRLGFVPAVILVYLIKRMGEGRAKEFVLRGEILDATQAKEVGLVTSVVDDEKLSESTYAFAEKLASGTSPSSIGLTKELFSRLNDMNIKEIMEYAVNLNALSRKTEDFKKGINAFIRKEKPEW